MEDNTIGYSVAEGIDNSGIKMYYKDKEELNKLLEPTEVSIDSSRKVKRISKNRIKKNIKKSKRLIYKLTEQGYSNEHIREVLNKKFRGEQK